MKTFNRTTQKPPMTDREEDPPKKDWKNRFGLVLLITGVLFSLMGLSHLSMASGFIKGIRSYFWASGDGTILSSDLRSHSTSGGGTVTYSVVIDGVLFEDTSEVFERWSGNIESKYDEWASRYLPGTSIKVYISQSGETSLGHWPTEYSYQLGIQGLKTLLMGLTSVCVGTILLKANPGRLATASPSPAT